MAETIAGYRIINWGRFQHYNKPRPLWIKLHRKLLDDVDFHNLNIRSRHFLVMLWLVAAESEDGTIPDAKAIAWRLRITEKEISVVLSELTSYIEPLYRESRESLASDRDREETEREREKSNYRVREAKIKHGETVMLTEAEHSSLVEEHGEENTRRLIVLLDDYKASKGKTYKSDFRAIRSWVVKALRERGEYGPKNGEVF